MCYKCFLWEEVLLRDFTVYLLPFSKCAFLSLDMLLAV